MKKTLITIVGLAILFFSSNILACDCDDVCDCWNAYEWCNCVTECNANNDDCVEFNIDCIEAWSGIGYLKFATCMKELLPYDMIYFNSEDNCTVATCKTLIQHFGWRPYKNIEECIKDQGSEFDPPWPWVFGDFVECEDSLTWVEGCECIKKAYWGD